MSTSRSDIERWYKSGKSQNKKWLIVVCDTFDYEDYPVYASTDKEFWYEYDHHNGQNMQCIMESYDLTKSLDSQINEFRCHREPKR
jgi:hypothetical protein